MNESAHQRGQQGAQLSMGSATLGSQSPLARRQARMTALLDEEWRGTKAGVSGGEGGAAGA